MHKSKILVCHHPKMVQVTRTSPSLKLNVSNQEDFNIFKNSEQLLSEHHVYFCGSSPSIKATF